MWLKLIQQHEKKILITIKHDQDAVSLERSDRSAALAVMPTFYAEHLHQLSPRR
jgi:hypothetical protein